MKTVIYYFTRTGVSEKLANEFAKTQNASSYKIEDNMNWKGVLGFIKAGYYATSKKSLPASYRKPQPDEQIILVMPLWAGSFPPAVRSFIKEISREKITLVVTSGNSILKDREGFIRVYDVAGENKKVAL